MAVYLLECPVILRDFFFKFLPHIKTVSNLAVIMMLFILVACNFKFDFAD